MVEHAELGREARRFAAPVGDERARHHHQRRSRSGAAPTQEQGEHLHRLAQAHVVGQAPAEREALQKIEPTKPLLLVVPELTDEARWHGGRPNPVEALELVAGALVDPVHTGGGQHG